MRFYTVQEVANLLRTTPTTIYRWCRSGKIPAKKIGKEWRISEVLLNNWLEETPRPRPSEKLDVFWAHLRPPEHLLVLTISSQQVYELEAAFFRTALAQGGRVFKGCWWQDEKEVREKLGLYGLNTHALEKQGLLSIINLKKRYEVEGVWGPLRAWEEEIMKTQDMGYPFLWGSGSPHLLACSGHPEEILRFEELLHHFLTGKPVVGICPYYMEDFKREWLEAYMDLTGRHTGVVYYQNGQVRFFRQVQ